MRFSVDDNRVIRSVAVIGPLLILAGGCNGKKRVEVFPVHGRVTYAGQGVPQAVVVFVPASDVTETAKKLRPFAYADAQGNFRLKTYVDGDGAPAGKYKVCIVAAAAGAAKSQKDGPATASQNQPAGVAVPAAVSKKYGSAETSGIEATVVDGENNLEPFVLGAGGTI